MCLQGSEHRTTKDRTRSVTAVPVASAIPSLARGCALHTRGVPTVLRKLGPGRKGGIYKAVFLEREISAGSANRGAAAWRGVPRGESPWAKQTLGPEQGI